MVRIQAHHWSLNVAAMYSPPRHRIDVRDYDTFLHQLGNKFIVGGDWNAKHVNWGSRITTPKGRNLYLSAMNCNCTYLTTGTPTYWPSDPNRLPDLLDFFVLKGIATTHIQIESNGDLSSDHTPIIATLSTHILHKPRPPSLISSHTNWNDFRSHITAQTRRDISLQNPDEVDDAVDTLTHLIQEAAYLSTPPAHSGKNPTHTTPLHIRDMVTQKRRARSRWQRSRNPIDKREYNLHARQLRSALQDIQNKTFETYISALSADDHSIWKATRHLKRPTAHIPPILREDGTWSITDDEKATTFAAHLSKVFTAPPPDPYHDTSDTVQAYLDSPCPMTPPIRPFTLAEVTMEVFKCKNHKAPGYDLITAQILKELPREAMVLLTTIYNSMLRLAYFPVLWKFAQMIMIPKPGKPPQNVTSYRPISLLPLLSKIFEKLFLHRLRTFTDLNNAIPNHQFGFRERHSTTHQGHRLVNEICKSLEEKSLCTAAFLDVQQAFDRVWHNGLLYKLKTALPTPYYLLFLSYLTDRNFQIKHNTATSPIVPFKAGVPQGSVLGPLLYLLFTADIPTTPNTTIATFADDTAILAASEDPPRASLYLQTHLDLLQDWLRTWRIKVNEAKSAHVTFTNRKTDCPPVTINGGRLPVQREVKYLGLLLDRSLTWRPHVLAKKTHIQLKLRQMHWLMGRKSKLSTSNKLRLYKAILKPIWTYGIQLWGCTKPSNTKIIQRIQSKILRMVFDAPWYVSNKTLHESSGTPFVKDEINRLSTNYLHRLEDHSNHYVRQLQTPPTAQRRLRRRWTTDALL